MTTLRPRLVSFARYVMPKPPLPRTFSITNSSNRAPVGSDWPDGSESDSLAGMIRSVASLHCKASMALDFRCPAVLCLPCSLARLLEAKPIICQATKHGTQSNDPYDIEGQSSCK